MAEEERQPQERSGELPRRVPGVNGRTPGQIRRGFLPVPGDDFAAASPRSPGWPAAQPAAPPAAPPAAEPD
ncbi:MAG: hypothetical protein WAK71_14060, partial [Streptosporangiaceae bacterium]